MPISDNSMHRKRIGGEFRERNIAVNPPCVLLEGRFELIHHGVQNFGYAHCAYAIRLQQCQVCGLAILCVHFMHCWVIFGEECLM